MSTISFRKSPFFRYISFIVLAAFVGLLPVQPGWAQVDIVMPPIGQMIHVTSHFEPPQMVGLKINLKDPFSFGFIMDQGQNPMPDAVKKEEFNKIIKYFLVSLAMPNKDMWVNLSPFESKRIIPEVFGQTEMGRDLLAQDYVLKQFTSSLMYPEEGLGKEFWDKVYAQAQARFGTTDINVNTFNKVWIVADHADVYQKGDTAFLVGSHLKVMLEQDFKAIEQNKEQFGEVDTAANNSDDAKTQMASQLVREIIIPAIQKEVNEGQSFAAVRQIYNAEIMATWFKKTLRASLLGQVFADKSKIAGQKASDPQAKEKIFQQYLMAYKQGVFNFIKREATPDGQVIPRRYLSGGMERVAMNEVGAFDTQNIDRLNREAVRRTSEDAGRLAEEIKAAEEKGIRPQVELPTRIPVSSEIERIEQSPVGQNSRSLMEAAMLVGSTGLSTQSPSAIAEETKILADELRTKAKEGLKAVQAAADNYMREHSPQTETNIEATSANLTGVFTESLPGVSRSDQATMLAAMVQPLAPKEEIDRAATTLQKEAGAKSLDLAVVKLVAPAAEKAPTEPAIAVQEHLNTIMPQVEGLQQDLTAYQGPDTNVVQQGNSDIKDILAALKGQQENLLAQLKDQIAAGPTAGPTVVVPQIDKIMPQVRVLQANLTALQNRVTDMTLKTAIGRVTGNLENTMAGLQQQRNLLAPQPNIALSAQPAAAVQDHFSDIISQGEALQGTFGAYQGTDKDLITRSSNDFNNNLAALKEQEADFLAQLKNAQTAGQAPTVVVSQIDRIMPQIRGLQANLTALQNKVTDMTLKTAIGNVTGRFENTMSGLQQQRNLLAPQLNNASTAEPATAVQEHLNIIMPDIEGLQRDLNTYQGPDMSVVQQGNSDIKDILAALKEQQDTIVAQLKDQVAAGPSARPTVVVPQIDRIMPQVRVLQANLTALQNKVTDMTLKETIGRVTGNLENTMAGLQQQRDLLASQFNDAALLAQSQKPDKLGGINLSNEHLTMNVKVDGAGMPLPPQYQDKAMMNLNGLVSIIRSITPITQQNVPALFELTK